MKLDNPSSKISDAAFLEAHNCNGMRRELHGSPSSIWRISPPNVTPIEAGMCITESGPTGVGKAVKVQRHRPGLAVSRSSSRTKLELAGFQPPPAAITNVCHR